MYQRTNVHNNEKCTTPYQKLNILITVSVCATLSYTHVVDGRYFKEEPALLLRPPQLATIPSDQTCSAAHICPVSDLYINKQTKKAKIVFPFKLLFLFFIVSLCQLRKLISDFSIFMSIMTFVGLDMLIGLETPKLIVPTEFKVQKVIF